MNIGYIIDLSGIIKEETLRVLDISGLYYEASDNSKLNLKQVLDFRSSVLRGRVGMIDKHIFFFVINNNDKKTLQCLSQCIDAIQQDQVHFSQSQNELHIVCSLTDSDGFSLREYNEMPCLRNNKVCVYSWILDEYDYSGAREILSDQRAHAIAKLISIVCRHRNALSLKQMDIDKSPVYNLFGDSSVVFKEKERDKAVASYYYFKSIQHLLNIPDKQLDEYMAENVLPYAADESELEKRIDKSSGSFLREQRIPIEATLITEKTQGLLIKSSEEDKDYLVDASDNKLVFIDELSNNQRWQINDSDPFVFSFRKRVDLLEEDQGSLSDEFLKALQDKLIVHMRTGFDAVNNEVSESRRNHVDLFKKKVDNYLLDFINKNGRDNYKLLSEHLTSQDVKSHSSNIDYGIAFMEYLEAGNGDYLVDQKVSAGDTYFKVIKDSLEVEEARRLSELRKKEEEIQKKYVSQEVDKPSIIKLKFEQIDQEINRQKETIRLCNFQLDNWYDEDAAKKLTARTRAFISVGCGVFAALVWLLFSYRCVDMSDYRKFQWILFVALLVIGFAVGAIMILKVVQKRKKAEGALKTARRRKGQLMIDCMNDMKGLVEKRYRHLLSFHGLKTMVELLEFVKCRKEDLILFRKTLFKLMLQSKLASLASNLDERVLPNDFNTIELKDIDVCRILFGPEENRRDVPYCFANGRVNLSEAFDNFRKKKVKFETTRFSLGYNAQTEFDQERVEKEVIPALKEDEGLDIVYTPLGAVSLLPKVDGVEMDDVHQGACGDCYFMATLASIAQMNPEFIIGKNGMVEEIGDDHKFFRVKFYDKDGNRVSFDIDNKFWNKNGKPRYAGVGKKNDEGNTYDPWVMAVEKAWAKANNEGYDGIEGASADGKERIRKVEYSFAVTGKSAFYCITKNIPDRKRLFEMMKKHFTEDHLPITLYSASESDTSFDNKDPYLVSSHAYALKSVNNDGTFNIFNPWNNHDADEDVLGKHYENVSIDFIKDNFDVVVFFGIRETDFASFERKLTNGANEKEVIQVLEEVLDEGLSKIKLDKHSLEVLMTEEVMGAAFSNATYLFSRNRLKDERGVNKDEQHLLYLEGERDSDNANDKLLNYLRSTGQVSIQPVVKRDDGMPIITILRVSPPYVYSHFYDV